MCQYQTHSSSLKETSLSPYLWPTREVKKWWRHLYIFLPLRRPSDCSHVVFMTRLTIPWWACCGFLCSDSAREAVKQDRRRLGLPVFNITRKCAATLLYRKIICACVNQGIVGEWHQCILSHSCNSIQNSVQNNTVTFRLPLSLSTVMADIKSGYMHKCGKSMESLQWVRASNPDDHAITVVSFVIHRQVCQELAQTLVCLEAERLPLLLRWYVGY